MSWFLTRFESRGAHKCREQWLRKGHEGLDRFGPP
jgi:hypothetical protein